MHSASDQSNWQLEETNEKAAERRDARRKLMRKCERLPESSKRKQMRRMIKNIGKTQCSIAGREEQEAEEAGGILLIGKPSVREHDSTHALTQLRLAGSHARPNRNRTESDFPVGGPQAAPHSPKPLIFSYLLLYYPLV